MASIKEITPWDLILCFFGSYPDFEIEVIPEYPDLELLKSDLNPSDLNTFEDLREEKGLAGILRFSLNACNSAVDKQCRDSKNCYVLDSVLRENNPFAYIDAPSIFMNLFAYLKGEEIKKTHICYFFIINTPYPLKNLVIEPGRLLDNPSIWKVAKIGFSRAIEDLINEANYLSKETLSFTRCYLRELMNCDNDFLESIVGYSHEEIAQLNGSLKVMEEEEEQPITE
ncbi:MAG: hypothetical protein ACFFDT_20900 [Candidatus Hodarchaeota archaeon]